MNLDNQVVLAHMTEKYKEEFQLVSPVCGQIGNPYTMIQVKSQKIPKAKILVRSYKRDLEHIIIQDNYMGFLMKEQIQETMSYIVQPIYGECKVYYKPPELVFPTEYAKDMKVEDFVKRKESMVHIYFYLPPNEEWDKRVNNLNLVKEKLGKKAYVVKGLLCYLKNREDYEQLSEENFQSLYAKKAKVLIQGIFLIEGEGAFRYLRWGE